MKNKGNILVVVLVSLLILSVTISAYLLGQNQKLSVLQEPIVQEKSEITITPTPIIQDETVNWKTYTSLNNSYSFKYPTDWTLRNTDYENAVFMANEKGSVGIVFSDSQYPYGFAGPGGNFEENDMNMTFLGKTIVVKEMNNSFVDFSVKIPREIHVIFGTGYPVASVGDSTKSVSDYSNSKETILKILSTFKFL